MKSSPDSATRNCDARNLGQVIRLHWGVGNGLHWTLDIPIPLILEGDNMRVE